MACPGVTRTQGCDAGLASAPSRHMHSKNDST